MDQLRVSAGPSRLQILNGLKGSKLLSPAELDRAVAANPDADGKAFISALIASGLVTTYQMEAIQQERFEELLIGNYEVLDKLGAGGMGTVYKARHRRMKRVVALKVLSRTLCKDDTFVKRFQREVETIARLSHPNIVMAYDADEGEMGHFLVMEYVNGADLAKLVQKRGPCSIPRAVSFILQAARGLAYAHQEQIIHRDIKPANLLCDATDVVKVTDLGLARLNPGGAVSAITGITEAGGILGTVDYMAPEQALDSTSIDHRADIYSLGATLYYLLLGAAPFQSTTVIATLLKHSEAPIPSLTAKRKEVPAELDEVFRRMLAKSPKDRLQSMTDVASALEAIQETLGKSGAPVSAGFSLAENAVPSSQPAEMPSSLGALSFPTEVVSSDQTLDRKLIYTPPGGLVTVLLVEPSRTQASIIRKFLQEQDVQTVITTASGQEALKLVRSHSPTAIVSALHLPDMTGIQLASQARVECKGVPLGFVLISSEGESKEAGTLSKSGLVVLLHKPFTPQQLVQALSAASAHSEQVGFPVQPATSPAKMRGKLRVLIVDDSSAARVQMRNILQGLGFTDLVEAANGAQAVATLAREAFDLIVTDYHMPYMDGRGLVGYLKQNPATATVPIVMVTADTGLDKFEAVRNLGVTAVCDKAFRVKEVRRILDALAY